MALFDEVDKMFKHVDEMFQEVEGMFKSINVIKWANQRDLRSIEPGDAVTTSLGNYVVQAVTVDSVVLDPAKSNPDTTTITVPRETLESRTIWLCKDIAKYKPQ